MPSLMFRSVFGGLVACQFYMLSSVAWAAKPKNEMLTLDAKPEPIAIDPARTAVIVVDMENDFAAKGGMFDRAGLDISGAQKVIPPTTRVLGAARAAGMKVVYLKMGYQPDLSDLGA